MMKHRSSNLLSNILEVKVSIITPHEASQCNEKFRQRRMYVDKVLGLDIFRREFTEMDFIESDVCHRAELNSRTQ